MANLLDAEMASRVTHLSVDLLNRGKGGVKVLLSVTVGERVIAEQSHQLYEWSNQRLLLTLPQGVGGEAMQLRLTIGERTEAVKLVFDNLRVFVG